MKKLVFLTGLVLFFTGCMTARFSVSRPQIAQPTDVRVTRSGVLKLDGIRVVIRPYNFSNDASVLCLGLKTPKKFDSTERAFYVELGFYPKTEGFEFNPNDVTLQFGDKTLKPVACFGPEYKQEIYLGSLFFFEGFKKAYFDSQMNELSKLDYSLTLEPKKWTGVLLRYEIYPPSVEELFSLSIAGLQRDGSATEIPQLDFYKKAAVIVDDLY